MTATFQPTQQQATIIRAISADALLRSDIIARIAAMHPPFSVPAPGGLDTELYTMVQAEMLIPREHTEGIRYRVATAYQRYYQPPYGSDLRGDDRHHGEQPLADPPDTETIRRALDKAGTALAIHEIHQRTGISEAMLNVVMPQMEERGVVVDTAPDGHGIPMWRLVQPDGVIVADSDQRAVLAALTGQMDTHHLREHTGLNYGHLRRAIRALADAGQIKRVGTAASGYEIWKAVPQTDQPVQRSDVQATGERRVMALYDAVRNEFGRTYLCTFLGENGQIKYAHILGLRPHPYATSRCVLDKPDGGIHAPRWTQIVSILPAPKRRKTYRIEPAIVDGAPCSIIWLVEQDQAELNGNGQPIAFPNSSAAREYAMRWMHHQGFRAADANTEDAADLA